jgi:zinc ribbon protein
MSQMYERHCPTCGISITADQRFCTNCGTVLEAQSPPPSQYGAQPPSQSYPYPQQTPPYAQQPQQMQPYVQQQVPSYAQSPQQQVPPYAQQQQQQNQSPIAEAFGALGLLFLLRGFGGRKYAGYRPQRQRSSCCGCLVLLVVLFLCLGVPALYYSGRTSITSLSKSLNYSSGSNNSSDSSSITTQPPITTTQINQTLPYHGADITIVDVKQSKAFMDDSGAGTTGVIRLDLKESNSSTSSARYIYSDSARLILPDKSNVQPYDEWQLSGPDANTSNRPNWIDFQIPTTYQISQLTLQLGTQTEAQELIALNGKANVTQYKAKTTHPTNASTQYAGLTWTVTAVTVSLDYKGQQADKGMQFVTVSLKVDNPSSQDFNAYWGDYMRLQSGSTKSEPSTETDFPLSFASGSSGGTGDVNFIMPAGSTSCTLLFLSTPSFPTSSSVNFQTV